MNGIRRPHLPTLRRLVVLLHFPATFGATAAAATILGAACAAAPMFSSSAGTAALLLALGPSTENVLTVSQNKPYDGDLVRFQDEQLREAASTIAELAEPVMTLTAPITLVTVQGSPVDAVLASRTGFERELGIPGEIGPTPGVWVPTSTSARFDVTPGASLHAAWGSRRATTSVLGLYQNHEVSKTDPFWAPLLATVQASSPDEPKPALVLTDEREFLRLATALQASGNYEWSFALRPDEIPDLTLARARAVGSGIDLLHSTIIDASTQLGDALQRPTVTTPLPDAIDVALQAQRSIAPPIQTLTLAGAAAALAGLMGAAVYGMRRRRVEMRALDAIGIRWGTLAGRGLVEGIIPILLGGLFGWMATWFTIKQIGPSSVIDPSAIRSSLWSGMVALVIAVVLLGCTTAVAARREAAGETGWRRRRSTLALGWELLAIALAAASLYEIEIRGTTALPGVDGSIDVDRLLLLFPILFIAGFAGLAVRGLLALSRGLRSASASWPTSLFLASRRLSAAPRVASLLVVAASLAIGMLTYAGTATTTLRDASMNKVIVSVGGDVSATTRGPIFPPPPGSDIAATNVLQLSFVRTGPEPSGTVTVLGIDPETFAGGASWRDSFANRPLSTLLADLGEQGPSVPALVVDGSLPSGSTLNMAGYQVPLTVIGNATAFPGEEAGTNVVVPAAALVEELRAHGAKEALFGATYRTFARGPLDETRAYLLSSGADPSSLVTAADQLNEPGFRALSWSFGFMELAGVVTGAIAIIGLVLYLQAGQRSRDVAYAFSRRMGLSSRAHLAAIAAELGGLLAAALVLGGTLACVALLLIYAHLDPLPSLPPGAVLAWPFALLAALLLAVAACAGLSALLVHRWSARAPVGRVLRYAE